MKRLKCEKVNNDGYRWDDRCKVMAKAYLTFDQVS